jgi:hypothetical protein
MAPALAVPHRSSNSPILSSPQLLCVGNANGTLSKFWSLLRYECRLEGASCNCLRLSSVRAVGALGGGWGCVFSCEDLVRLVEGLGEEKGGPTAVKARDGTFLEGILIMLNSR